MSSPLPNLPDAQRAALRAAADAELCSRTLRRFVEKGWPVLEPETAFVGGWHLDALCEHLEAVTAGEIGDLLINIPPGHTKSLTVAVFWPAWMWVTQPHLRFLFSSHSGSLATRDSLRCRRLIESEWYQQRWSDRYALTSDQNVKTRYENDRTGFRLAFGVGGSVTGERGDVVACDDPHNILSVETSKLSRERALLWWDHAMSTRLNDPTKSHRVVIMQRVHNQDLSGHLLDQGTWEHLMLPAEFEERRRCSTSIGFTDPRTTEGEMLWPERYPQEQVDRIKRELGSRGAAGQLQQRPSTHQGNVLQRDWWRWVEPAHMPTVFDRVIQAWDFSFGTEKIDSSYTVGFVLGIVGPNVYFLDCKRRQCAFPDQLAMVRDTTAEHPEARRKVMERAANAFAAIQTLKTEIPGIVPIQAKGSKMARAEAWSPYLEAGNVHVPKGVPWADLLVDECADFPNGAYDDLVDAAGWGIRDLLGGKRARVFDLDFEPAGRASPWKDS